MNPSTTVQDASEPLDPQGSAPAAGEQMPTVRPASEVSEGGPDVRAFIKKLIQQAKVPGWLRTGWDRWEADQEYLHTSLFADENSRQMTVNIAARLIQSKLASIIPTDADISVKHERPVADAGIVRKDAIREGYAQQMAQFGQVVDVAALIKAADQAESEFRMEVEARERFAMTGEAMAKKLADEAKLTKVAGVAGLAAFTTGLAWIKVGWQEDYGRDTIGNARNDDSQNEIALLALRASEYAAGIFSDDDARYTELKQLTEYARMTAQRQQTSQQTDPRLSFAQWSQMADLRDGETPPPNWLPEPDRWQGVTFDNVNARNMRWDFRFRFAEWKQSPWAAEQVLKDLDEAAAEFRLTPAERDLLGKRTRADSSGTNRNGVNVQRNTSDGGGEDPTKGDYESAMQGGRVVVWDYWIKATRRHVVFIEGLDRLLVDEVPEVTTPWFYPWTTVSFNDLDNAMLPPSEVRFLRKICDAINQRLTDGQESLWASMKRYLVKKGAFEDGELDKLRGSVPHDVIEVRSPEEIKAAWMEIASDDWNGEKYKLDDLFRLLELVMGMSLAQLGVVDMANTATEASIAESRSQQQSARHGMIMASAMQECFHATLTYSITCLGQRAAKLLLGKAAYWPMPPTRMDLLRGLRVKVEAAGNRLAARTRASDDLQKAIGSLNAILDTKAKALAVGFELDIAPLVSAAMRASDIDAGMRDLFQPKPLPEPMPQAMPGQPGAPGSKPGLPGPVPNPSQSQAPGALPMAQPSTMT